MLWEALFVAATLGADPLGSAVDAFAALQSYRVTMRSTLADGQSQVVRYHYRKPGFVRMEFVRPHRGALLVYDPHKREAVLRPFGEGVFPRLALDPDHALIRSPRGHTVDRSDAGVLLENIRALQREGTTKIVGEEPVGGANALHVRVVGAAGVAVDGVHRYDVWLQRTSLFPVKAESRGPGGELVESMTMDDIEIDPVLRAGLFDG